MLQTLYLSREPADIFNKSIEKNTINYLSKAYSFIMNIFMNTAKQVDIFIVKTNNDFSLSWTYDSTIPKILRREAETLDQILLKAWQSETSHVVVLKFFVEKSQQLHKKV